MIKGQLLAMYFSIMIPCTNEVQMLDKTRLVLSYYNDCMSISINGLWFEDRSSTYQHQKIKDRKYHTFEIVNILTKEQQHQQQQHHEELQ